MTQLTEKRQTRTRRRKCSIDVVTDIRGFLSLRSAWSELLRASRFNNVFLTHEWFRCWWEAFGAGSQMCILCARDNGRLVGIAPLHIRRTTFRGLPIRKLSFMINACSAEVDFILARPAGRTLEAMLNYLAERQGWWDFMELARLRDDSLTWRQLPAAARHARLSLTTRQGKQTPYITVNGQWDCFLAQRSRNFRKTVRRRLNRIRKHPEAIRVVQLRSPQQIAQALPYALEISSRSWKADRKAAITDRSGQMLFYKRLSELLGEQGWIDLWLLYCGDKPMAFEYHLNYQGVTSPIRADFDEQFTDLSPGAHLEYEVLRSLFDDPGRAITEYNTCADGYAYEKRWTDLIRPHSRAWIFGRGVYGRALYALGLLRRRHKPDTRNSVRDAQ